jgi:hypothetical protein
MLNLKIGDRIQWRDRDGNRFTGYVALFVPKGTAIPDGYRIGPARKDYRRICDKQRIARRDDRWLIDCGMDKFGQDEDGKAIMDVVYRMLPDWNRTVAILYDF